MKFLSNPNLPDTMVKTVAIGEGNTDVIKELKKLGIDVVELKSNKNLGNLSNHADMLLFDGGNGNFFLDSEQNELCEKINKWGGKTRKIEISENAEYPNDVLLNAAVVGDYLICNTKTISKKILDSLDLNVINVKQGYSKCSTCIVSSDAIITDDLSIYNAAVKSIDVLLVKKGDIKLRGFNYGFIGGATVKLDKNNLGVIGKLNTHADANNIKAFLKNHFVDVIELSNEQITDIGGIIPLMV